MSFMDNLKRSLGFEENEIRDNSRESALSNISNMFNNMTKSSNMSNRPQQPKSNSQYQYRPRPTPTPNEATSTVPDEFEVITPEQSFYEVILIRPKTIDDINYVVDQVIEENNPVILDLSFLEKESPANFKLAGDKIKQMRARYGVQALLLARTEDKDLIIVSPKKVRVINKS